MKQKSNIQKIRPRFQEGDRIAAINRFDSHSYQRGVSYVVIETDHNDQTLKAQDESGRVGEWIPWSICTAAWQGHAA